MSYPVDPATVRSGAVLDAALRARLTPPLQPAVRRVADAGVRPGAITAVGLAVGIGACVAAALAAWGVALALWLLNRAIDWLDGAVARAADRTTDLGGLLDFVADFVVYGGFVVGVAIAVPDARVACTVLLAAYLVNNVALLSFASLVEKRRLAFGDERSLRFTPGLAEATEATLAYVAFCLLPAHADVVAWVFAAAVAVTIGQRLPAGRHDPALSGSGSGRRHSRSGGSSSPTRLPSVTAVPGATWAVRRCSPRRSRTRTNVPGAGRR